MANRMIVEVGVQLHIAVQGRQRWLYREGLSILNNPTPAVSRPAAGKEQPAGFSG